MPVTAEVKTVIKVLRGILSDLNNLDDEQLQALINGEAKFKYVDPNAAKGTNKTPSIMQERIEEIVDTLKKCNSIEEATSYLEGQKKELTVDSLKAIAKHVNMPILSKRNKPDIMKALVESTIGAILRDKATQRT